MADHLAAGRGGDTEIAIQEEVAKAPSGEFGIAGFDVGKLVDDSVPIHLKPPPFLLARSRQSPASNFLAARIGAFEALLCYAKITPAALHRGDFADRRREGAEAAGGRPKFGLSVSQCAIAGPAAAVVQALWMASSYAKRARCLSRSNRQPGASRA
jgi:hypothetical protein